MDLDVLARPLPKGDPAWPRLRRALATVTGSASGSARVHAYTDDLARIQQPVTTCRRILVAGVRGGAGATTVAALLAGALARFRSDAVLACETNRGHGSLAYRLTAVRPWSGAEVAGLLGGEPDDAVRALAGQRGQVHLLTRPGGLDLETYRETYTALLRFFGVAVLDAGHDAMVVPGHLGTGHSLVLAIPATLDGMRTALTWYGEVGPQRLPGTVAVLVEQNPGRGLNLARAADRLRAAGSLVCVLRYDRSLAAGAPLSPRHYAEATTPAVVQVAAAALTAACGNR
jgi:hypothetical protein